MRKTIRIAAGIFLALVVLALILCRSFKIHLFTSGIKDRYVDRVDKIDGFYVAVNTQTTVGYEEDGEPTVAMGDCSGITEYDWKHEELNGIVAYKRILCFSREAEYETYRLENEDGTLCYGAVYVLRAPRGTIHYYYKRLTARLNEQYAKSVLTNENVAFRCGEDEYPLTDYCRFSSDTDFTTGENALTVNGDPCRFVKQ